MGHRADILFGYRKPIVGCFSWFRLVEYTPKSLKKKKKKSVFVQELPSKSGEGGQQRKNTEQKHIVVS